MIQNRNKAGFTLIELMIVVAIIAIIASIAIPRLMSARLSANESAAVATLRSISSAQAQLQSSSAIDTDSDGGGEYGYFAELAGVDPLRIDPGGGAAPVVGPDNLQPSVLSTAFGDVDGNGVVSRSGYCFQMWLPDNAALGVQEVSGGGAIPDPDNCEILWAAYAWPIQVENTGNRAFFINQEGDLLSTANRPGAAARYTTAAGGPASTAAINAAGGGADMSDPIASGAVGLDGNTWVPVQ